MANRRMTNLEVIDTDAFLDMPQSTQLLYFHLNARADDDGFVSSPRKIMRSIGGQADDLRVLAGKKFIIIFEDGVCVLKHWRINNFIRKDIYNETKYLDHKKTLFIRPNGAYTQTNDNRAIPVPRGHFSQKHVDEALTGREPSKEKKRLDKKSKQTDHSPIGSFDDFWKEYPKKVGKQKCLRWWKSHKPSPEFAQKMISAVQEQKQTEQWQKEGGSFIPHPYTWLNQGRWEDEVEKPQSNYKAY